VRYPVHAWPTAGTGVTVGFEEYVAARYAVLLRTAYVLTQDCALAEDLLQTTLGPDQA